MCAIMSYDKNVLALIKQYKYPEKGFFSNINEIINKPFQLANEAIDSIPLIWQAFEKATSGLVSVFNNDANFTVCNEAIYEEYRKDGFLNVHSLKEISNLKLENCDKTVGRLGAKYNTLAATEGAASGSLAGPLIAAMAIAADVPTFTTLCLRAIGEYATYYGFDTTLQQERVFMLQILNYASDSTDKTKQLVLANLAQIARKAASGATEQQLDQHDFVTLTKQLASVLGIRITKGKVAMFAPAVGALFNSGYNVYIMNKVCDAAYMLYRERYLARYYDSPNLIHTK